jgi:arylsulfatase A-like enzyme
MPHTLHLIADRGVRFVNAIAPTPLCAPSRATLLTGQVSHNHGVLGNSAPTGGYRALDNKHTLATWLHAAGYRTGFVGKYLNGYTGRPPSDRHQPGWDVFEPILRGLYSYYGYRLLEADGSTHWYARYHSDDVVADHTTTLVHRFARQGTPFFLWSSYVAPHYACDEKLVCGDAPVPAARHDHVLTGARSPHIAKPSFNERDVSDKPPTVRSHKLINRRRAEHIFTKRIQTLQSADEGVAATVHALAREGVLTHTLVVFLSDNGYMVGEHRLVNKVFPYRESIEVPVLIRGPGIPRGRVRNQLVTVADLPATFAALAHATPDLVLDGASLLPYAQHNRPQPDTTRLIEKASPDGTSWLYQGVRTHRYTYVEWGEGFRELYDHRTDPYELNNLAHSHPQAEARLASQLAVLKDCAGADCR